MDKRLLQMSAYQEDKFEVLAIDGKTIKNSHLINNNIIFQKLISVRQTPAVYFIFEHKTKYQSACADIRVPFFARAFCDKRRYFSGTVFIPHEAA